MPFYVGLDLGQAADYTALAVVQGGTDKNPETGEAEKYLRLRHLERYELRTPYPEIRTDRPSASPTILPATTTS